MTPIRRLLPLLATYAALAAPALGAWPPVAPSAGAPSPRTSVDEGEEGDDEGAAAEDEQETWFAVVGGDVHVGNGAVLRGATILSRDGVIVELGNDVFVPEEAEVLDASGLRVYPGMVAIESAPYITNAGNGAFEADLDDIHAHVDEPETVDPEELLRGLDSRSPTAAAIEDGFDPFGQPLVLALATGITTTASSGAAVKLKRGEIEDLVLREGYLRTMAWSSHNPSGKRALREKFEKARDWIRDHAEWEKRPKSRKDEKEPSDKDVDKEAVAVLRGQARALFPVNDRGDLLSLARFAQELEFRPVISGCIEGWTVADELGRAGAAAIVTPRTRRAKDEELVRPGGATIENAATLHAAGVQVAIIPADSGINLQGIMGRDLMHLPIEAAFAVRGGLPESAALEAVTVVPARLLGVADRVGTIAVGKDCDVIVTDGDLLHYQTFVQYTVVAGKLAYDKQEEIYFAHIRPREVREPVLDPGEEPEPEPEPEAAAPAEDAAEDAGDGDSEETADDEEPEESGDAGDESDG